MQYELIWVETTGDRDQKTSLRTLGKSDFFTRELDQMLLRGEIDLAIHSAKDLPEPLPEGLVLAFLTKGLDPRDSLVLRDQESIETLPNGAWIATSSERREEAVLTLRKDFRFKDVRGKVAERLALLERGEADGVVIAEAALLRLGLTHLNRLQLPGPTAPGQGQLAVVCRQNFSDDLAQRSRNKCCYRSQVEKIPVQFRNLDTTRENRWNNRFDRHGIR